MLNKNFVYSGLAALAFLTACTNDNSNSEEGADSTVTIEQPLALDSADQSLPGIQPLPYIVQFDENTGKFNIDKNPASETVQYSSEALAEALNHKYPEILLRLGETKQDTLELYIDEATYLTQSIGSAGANNYLAEATFAFTSLDSVSVVNFIFEPGDHAMPGPYNRKFFDDFH